MFANSNRSKKRLIVFSRRKKTTLIFFRKLITTISLRETITYFFFRKREYILLKNELKRFQMRNSKTKSMHFREKKRRRYKKFTYFEKNANYFTILNHFVIFIEIENFVIFDTITLLDASNTSYSILTFTSYSISTSLVLYATRLKILTFCI